MGCSRQSSYNAVEYLKYRGKADGVHNLPAQLENRRWRTAGCVQTTSFCLGFCCDCHCLLGFSLGFIQCWSQHATILESFFGKLRGMGGHNNNPDGIQLKSAIRKLLAKQYVVASTASNCLASGTNSGVFARDCKRKAP